MAAPAGEAGKYAALAPNARGHSSWFLTRTNAEHQATMEHPFMRTIYAKTFDKEAYVQYLVGQYLIFEKLEALCDTRKAEGPLKAVFDTALLRLPALAADLQTWVGPGWKSRLSKMTPKTAEYLQQLDMDSKKDVWGLVCHHFLQYNAVLSGGQFLGGIVANRAKSGLPPPPQASGSPSMHGARFFEFPSECQPTHLRVQKYIDQLDALDISQDVKDQMLSTMRRVYSLLLGMFDEVYAVAPLEGVSYKDGLAGATSVSSSSSGESARPKQPAGVPPPLTPGKESFTLKELHEQGGKRLLVSLLGRVYDCSAGKEFFGRGGPYEIFAGRDGTYNLAVMSLKTKTLDHFNYSLDEEEKEALAEWIAYFDHRYGAPVGSLRDPVHSVRLEELPRPKKIPFSSQAGSEEPEEAAETTGTPQSKL